MKIVVLFALIVLIQPGLYSQPRYIDPVMLSWSDYKGHAKYDSGFLAYTDCKIDVTASNNASKKSDIHFHLVFYPESSWADWNAIGKKPHGYSDSLFRHELLHYYIGIIAFKKLKVAFQHFRFKDHQDLTQMRNQITNFLAPYAIMQRDMNAKYDKETRYGIDRRQQNHWEHYIMKNVGSLKNVRIDAYGN
jgi:Bacterial protein of unknown function (DUF922)